METTASIHEEEEIGKVYDSRLMARLLAYLAPYKGRAILAVALIVASSLLQLVGPLATALALDLFIEPLGGTAPPTPLERHARAWIESTGGLDPVNGVLILAGIYVVALFAAFVIQVVQSYVMQVMGQRIMYDMRRDVFARLQRLPVAFFDRQPVGRLVTRATNDVASLNELFTSGLVSVFGDIFLLAGIIAVLFVLDWRLALVSFAVLPLLGMLTAWFKSRARKVYRETRVKIARINSFLQEQIGGMAVVQLFTREERCLEESWRVNDELRDAHVRAIRYYAFYFPAVELITALGLALIVWYGGGAILRGTLSLGALVAFLQYAQRFYQPLADLSEKYNILQAAMASSERIFELLDSPLDIESPRDGYQPPSGTGGSAIDRPGIQGSIELRDVSFAYDPDEPVLRDVSFRIEPGETVAVVGHTGAGKSTLASLILRFYDVSSGAVEVDGVDVRQWHLPSLRGGVAMVLQDVFLFAGDIASNIRLGQTEIDEARLRRAAREVNALPFIERLPEGFATRLEERGAGLSVGQKQLLAFARALAFDPRILILDEATASVDSETEQRIQEALERLLIGRTSLVIAHRLSTIRRADRILVLHKGELREMGTHDELVALGGIYHKLYQLQFRDDTAEPALSA
ncbi:MAG: ABC transporter ATP-binding protein/permease [Holophagales bacterium]|nr:ABC transporter ATP-binding protein/permease [Holophagales bacterium]